MTRLTRDEYGLLVARAVAGRADCSRRQVGAVIIAPDGSIVSTGYNGLAAGKPGCLSDGACPRGRMTYDAQPADVDYQATGCRAVHAEVNAILRAGRDRTVGATIYVTDEPCFHCSVVIEGAGIARVVTPTSHDDEQATERALARRGMGRPWPEVKAEREQMDRVVSTTSSASLLETPTFPAVPTVQNLGASPRSGPLDPELLAALERQEARIKAHRDGTA